MLVQVGRRNSSEEVVDLLAECHGRIRRFLVMARALLDAPPGTPQAEIAATAGQIARYFTSGFRLHVEDEEVEIAPRIARDAARQLRLEHDAHVHDLAELIACCARLVRHPEQLATIASAMQPTIARLAVTLEAHLEFEERVVFPAIRALAPEQRDAIRRAMRARREHSLYGTVNHAAAP
jgi:hemerythrin-like domain-containing protein